MKVKGVEKNVREGRRKTQKIKTFKSNEKIMRKINGSRKGVPQGPAYARLIAETFLGILVEKVIQKLGNHEEKLFIYRYVDDIVIFCNPNMDGDALYQNIRNTLLAYGLPFNLEKSQYMGFISELSKQQRSTLLHADKMTYELSETDFRGPLLPFERKEMLNEYF